MDQETLVKAPKRTGRPGRDGACGDQGSRRQIQSVGKVVGAAAGNIAQQGIVTALLQAGDDLVQGAVPAAGDDDVRFAGMIAGKIHGIAALIRHTDGTEIAGTVEDGDNLR